MTQPEEKDQKPVPDKDPRLGESTRDDTDEGWGERSSVSDDWWREQRPPHWD
jgi:hypothetical protein